jgi:PadR family transcriptional regulator, regulatory protein PadR
MIVSKATVKILRVFLESPETEQYGFGLMGATGVKSGSLYPILDRLHGLGWVEVRDEPIDEQAEGRPKRRLYKLTSQGRAEGLRVVRDFYADLGKAPNWVPGLESS